jgi:hypothetical protein
MILFTLYMITDPQTSPSRLRSQILFGAAIACAYSILLVLHVQFTMFYSVSAVCLIRGLCISIANARDAAAKRAAFRQTGPLTPLPAG